MGKIIRLLFHLYLQVVGILKKREMANQVDNADDYIGTATHEGTDSENPVQGKMLLLLTSRYPTHLCFAVGTATHQTIRTNR